MNVGELLCRRLGRWQLLSFSLGAAEVLNRLWRLGWANPREMAELEVLEETPCVEGLCLVPACCPERAAQTREGRFAPNWRCGARLLPRGGLPAKDRLCLVDARRCDRRRPAGRPRTPRTTWLCCRRSSWGRRCGGGGRRSWRGRRWLIQQLDSSNVASLLSEGEGRGTPAIGDAAIGAETQQLGDERSVALAGSTCGERKCFRGTFEASCGCMVYLPNTPSLPPSLPLPPLSLPLSLMSSGRGEIYAWRQWSSVRESKMPPVFFALSSAGLAFSAATTASTLPLLAATYTSGSAGVEASAGVALLRPDEERPELPLLRLLHHTCVRVG